MAQTATKPAESPPAPRLPVTDLTPEGRYERRRVLVLASAGYGATPKKLFALPYADLRALFLDTTLVSWEDIGRRLGIETVGAAECADLYCHQRQFFSDIRTVKRPRNTEPEGRRARKRKFLAQPVEPAFSELTKYCATAGLTVTRAAAGVGDLRGRMANVAGVLECSLHYANSAYQPSKRVYVAFRMPRGEYIAGAAFSIFYFDIQIGGERISDFCSARFFVSK